MQTEFLRWYGVVLCTDQTVLVYLSEFEYMVTFIMCHGPSHQTPSNSLTVLGQIVKGCVGDSLFTIASNSSLDLPTTLHYLIQEAME